MSDDVVVTGIGMVTPLGPDAPGTWTRLLAGDRSAGRIDDVTAEPARRGRVLADRAAAEAIAMAGAGPDGVYVGTTMGESAAFEEAAETGRFDLAEAGGQVFAQHLRRSLGFDGPAVTFGTACAAGNYAIGAAAAALRALRVTVALAGGVEPYSRIAQLGFSRMRAVDPVRCRPFAPDRAGMRLGEAAAFLVLERADDARRRGASVVARFGGVGLTCDASHPTAPRTDGSGLASAMDAALRAADVKPRDVGWVSAHGTGTPRSDAAEATALATAFDGEPPPVSSIKGAIGHSLGAATAVEAAVAVLALRDGVVPPNAAEADPALGLDVPTAARPAPGLAWVLSNGLAFGGLNTALALGAA
jgi:3-oxoacyl-[acyl-carrier-protein] synthase II